MIQTHVTSVLFRSVFWTRNYVYIQACNVAIQTKCRHLPAHGMYTCVTQNLPGFVGNDNGAIYQGMKYSRVKII